MPRPKVPPATLVLLVRHGQTPTTGKYLPGPRSGPPPRPRTGQRQAELAAKRIAELKKVDAVYASPLERTRETAAPIAAACGLRVQVDRALLECDFGQWTGAELKELMKRPEWKQVQRYPAGFRFPDGESFTEMQVRITTGLARLRARHPGGVVVAVSHADPIKAAVSDAMGAHLDLFQRTVISTVLDHGHRLRRGRADRADRQLHRRLAGRAAARPSSMAMSPSFDLGDVDAFTAGTVGEPGQRIFYLQARSSGQVITVKCEKQHVAALGQHLQRLLQDLPDPGEGPLPTALELVEPVEPVWVAGQLGVAWDPDLDRFVVRVEELDQSALEAGEEDDEDDDDAAAALIPLVSTTSSTRATSGWSSPAGRRWPSPAGRRSWSPRAGRPAASAGCRWTRTATPVPG